MMTRKHIAALLMLGCGLYRPGWADIYTYTADDGTVSLSNVPTDERFTVLITAPEQALAAAPFGVPAKSQFFLPTTKGRMAFSAALLSGVATPWSQYSIRRVHCLSV